MITKSTKSGDITLATLSSGDILGEMSLFDKMPRSAAAVASGDARVLSIDKKKLFKTIGRDPTLVFKIIETMSQRIRVLNEELSKLNKTKLKLLKIYSNIEDTCRMVLDEAKNIITSDNGSVMLFDDKESLSIKAAFGKKSESTVKLFLGEGIAGDVLKTGRAELVNNVYLDSRFVPGKTKIRSLLCVPLKCKECIFGVVNLSNTSERLFSLDDLKLLNSLSIYASVAVQNAINFSKLKNVTEEVLSRVSILG